VYKRQAKVWLDFFYPGEIIARGGVIAHDELVVCDAARGELGEKEGDEVEVFGEEVVEGGVEAVPLDHSKLGAVDRAHFVFAERFANLVDVGSAGSDEALHVVFRRCGEVAEISFYRLDMGIDLGCGIEVGGIDL